MGRRYGLMAVMLIGIAGMALAWEVSAPAVAAEPGLFARPVMRFQAALELREPGVYELAQQRLRCAAGQAVGLLVSGRDVEVRGALAVDGSCETAVMVTAGSLRHLTLQTPEAPPEAPAAGQADGVTAAATPRTCVFGAGGIGQGIFEQNQVGGGCQYGIYLAASGYTVVGNLITGATQFGVFVIGHQNHIEANVIWGNARRGIYVGRSAPMTGPKTAILDLRGQAYGNVIVNNLVEGHEIDIQEWASQCEPTPENPDRVTNTWGGNITSTGAPPKDSPACLQP